MGQSESPQQFYRWFALVATLFCSIFLITTITLAFSLWISLTDIQKGSEASSYGSSENIRRLFGSKWPLPSGSLYSEYKRASIATDHGFCSEVGRDVMIEGGNSVEATIASLLCIGVVNPQSSGLGGGFLMTIYNSTTGKCMAINARETAPLSASEMMFVKSPKDSVIGYRSIATPGELHGYWTVFQRFGSGQVTWKRLLEPSIKLARDGFPVSSNLAMLLQREEGGIREDKEMNRTFVNPTTGKLYEEGDILKRVKLANFMEELANSSDPVKLFYNGRLAELIAKEINNNGGHITTEDLARYETIVYDEPIEGEVTRNGLQACGPPPPSSSVLASSIIGIMSQFYPGNETVDLNDPLVYHRLIEAEKFVYAQRTKLGDIAFVDDALALSRNLTKRKFIEKIASLVLDIAQPLEYYSLDLTALADDHGTSHVSAIDTSGNAVSTTSSINQYFGSKRESPELGIIWNDSMDDFSTPNMANAFGFAPSPTNFIVPGKRPMSSMSPLIIYDKASKKVKMVIGASGGSRIISSIAQTAIRTLLFGQTVKEAVDAPRFHNQFLPHQTEFEETVPEVIVESLITQRHQNLTAIDKQASVVQALIVDHDGLIHGNSDFRRKTATFPAGF